MVLPRLRGRKLGAGAQCGQSGKQEAGGLGWVGGSISEPHGGWSVVVAGSAALAGQDRRLEVSAPVEVRTAAYHASRCALASPPGSWVHLSGRWRLSVG